MDSFELTKIAGAVLLTMLAAMVISVVGNSLVHPKLHEAVVAAGEGKPGAVPAKKEEAPIEPIAPLLASASVPDGEKAAKKCATCHDFAKGGKPKVGPPLWGVVGRAKGHVEGFSYSKGMSEKGGEWTYEDLNHFIANPKGFVAGTKMAYAGDKKAKDRADIIAYLRSLSDSPAPLP
jgi:cytochrome c